MRNRRRDKIFKQRTWEKVKALAAKKNLQMDYEEEQNGVIRAFVRRGSTEFFVNLFPPDFGHVVGKSDTNDADYQEFVNTYMAPVDEDPPAEITHVLDPISGAAVPQWTQPHAGDGKPRVLASHKPVIAGKEAYNFFTSTGDDNENQVLGSGTPLMVQTVVGTAVSQCDLHFSPEIDFMETVYIFGGALNWEGAGWGDCLSLEIRANSTPVLPDPPAAGLGLDVDYVVEDERLRYVGPGSGTHALGGYPVWVPNFKNQGHFNLDKAAMTPVPVSGTGAFDWYTTEQFVGHYVSDMLIYGSTSNPVIIDATESAPLPQGHWLRLRVHNNTDTEFKVWGFMKMYRERLK